ncbi:hypothetical protein SeMB42_g03270 [Synchytrium endobioticum]|uniref:Uncharacterized protein n=1 Tax=Synchytrium endobioticum TaxID=286115 RepID=A0A507D1J6_9FUNG|nr:hypothetical protein SeLEV6574_g04099 [Synchytrium endobioticum]TPX47613.1 hypothetical protein SeMB42_g03270 [Synchytrium endobioticum]
MTVSKPSSRLPSPIKPFPDSVPFTPAATIPERATGSWRDNRSRSMQSDIFSSTDLSHSPFLDTQKAGNRKNVSSIHFGNDDSSAPTAPSTGRRRSDLPSQSSSAKIFGTDFNVSGTNPAISRRPHRLDSDIFGAKAAQSAAAKAAEPVVLSSAKNDCLQSGQYDSYGDYESYSNNGRTAYEAYPQYGGRYEDDYSMAAKYDDAHDSSHCAKEEASYVPPNPVPYTNEYSASKVAPMCREDIISNPATPSSAYSAATPSTGQSKFMKSTVFDTDESTPLRNRRHYMQHYESAPDLLGDATTVRSTPPTAGRRAVGSAPFATSDNVAPAQSKAGSRRNDQTFDLFGSAQSSAYSGREHNTGSGNTTPSAERAFGLSSNEAHKERYGRARHSHVASQIIFGP